MKTCPECGNHDVIMFDSNNDLCQTCNKWFPAVAEEKCVAGCKVYTSEEIKHHKDCLYYPESLTKVHDDMNKDNEKLITKLADDICAVAKKLKNDKHEINKISEELKTISGCLHDMRRNHDTEWYKKFEVKEKQ